MKFANVIFDRNERLTIGDDMQLLAIENLYRYMGVNYDEVIRIPFHSLYNYDGEYVVLPVSFPLYGYNHDIAITQFSPKILPVFLGLSTLTTNYSSDELVYLNRYEPIGCRDIYTMNALRKNNVSAYLNGCMTAAFPHKWTGPNGKEKVFCIDVNDDFKKYIPERIMKHCEFSSHMFYPSELPNGPEEKARELYEKYIQEARMIITTRLHGALPCLAAGIPVILAKDNLSFRFAGIDKLIHVYTKEEYSEIDWNPQPILYEDTKKQILESAAMRMWDTYNKFKGICEVSEFYESRENREYYIEFYDNTISYIKNRFEVDEEFEYVLWGVTQTAELIYNYMRENYKRAKLVAVIDKTKRLEFCGVETCTKEYIYNNKNKFYFVCTGAAIREAYNTFDENGITDFYQCCEDGHKHRFEERKIK